MKTTGLVLVLLTIVACHAPQKPVEKEWSELNRVVKTIHNITYIFPADVDLKTRNEAIKMSEISIRENLELIEEESFTDTITFEFLHTRAEMKRESGRPVKGLAIPQLKLMYSLIDLSESSAIKHELMHMILSLKWGYSDKSMRWFNEGLATYSGTICGKTNFDELYYYYVTHDLLIPMEYMIGSFYHQDEVIGYSQGAYIVKYLSEEYGWKKLRKLWEQGFNQFGSIFGKEYNVVQTEMHKKLEEQFPEGIDLEWERIKIGCP